MISFLRVAKPFPNLPSRSLTLVTHPYLHLPNHSFVFITNASIFDLTLHPFFDLLSASTPVAAISITHTLMLSAYAACTRRPLTRYHRESKQTSKRTNIHYRRLSARVRVIYFYYALDLSLFLHSTRLLRQMRRAAELSRTGAPLF